MVSTVACQHCGDEHPPGLWRCERTADLMTEPGPCGTKIDRYLVKKLLGVGGFGAVYLAEHTRTAAKVALKVLKKERADDAAAVERFMREARAAAMLGSEHITRVLDAEVSIEGVPFIAMELLDGVDLEKLDKERGPIHPERLVSIMIQTLDALQVAHERGIVHRDMKPANVFITKRRDELGVERDFVKLLDFGISKMQATGERALTLAGTTMGTPAYMAYEQFFDARSVDGRADVYSVAAILYELLARRRPYIAASYGELVMKVEKETPLPLRQAAPSLPDALCAAVDRGLKKDRGERWQSARDLADALKKIGSLRGVVLKTEISQPAAPVVDRSELQTRARQVPTTEPRGAVARGEVRTVLMDPSLAAAASPSVVVTPEAAGPVPQAPTSRATGNSTVLMDSPLMPPAPSAREKPGNSTVLMGQVSDEPSQLPTDPYGRESLPVAAVLHEASQKSTDPLGQQVLPGPRDELSTSASLRAAGVSSEGLVDKLGWKLLGALGLGALVVLGLLIWVLSLAARAP